MKCEKCGQEIDCLLVDVFRWDGSDDFDKHPVFECEENAVYIETNQNWTGYEQTEEEMLETIICPHCKQFPFKDKEIQVYEVVRIVCFKEKIVITPEQAISILPDGEFIHTFYNPGFGLIGADWSKADIIEKLRNSYIIELAGPTARCIGHGMCAYGKNAEILFVETDEARLFTLEKEIENQL